MKASLWDAMIGNLYDSASRIYRPGSRQVASTKPRSQRCAGPALRRGCHIRETMIASVRTGSGKLLTSAGPRRSQLDNAWYETRATRHLKLLTNLF